MSGDIEFWVTERYGFLWRKKRRVKYVGSITVWYRVDPKHGTWRRASTEMEFWLAAKYAQREWESERDGP